MMIRARASLEALAHPPQHAGEVFHFVPAKSSKAKPSLRSPFMSGRLYCLASTESKSHVGLGNLRLHPAVGQVREARVADHVARVACNHQAAGVPLVRGQGHLRREALRLHQLVVDHDQLALVRPAALQEDPRALVAQQPLSGAALLLDTCSPARPVRQEEIGERVGGETVPEPVQSRLSQSSGPVEAAPVMVSVAPVSAPVAAVAAPEAVSVPVHVAHCGEVPGVGRVVDGESAARDSCGGGDLVGCEHILVRARPVGQQRARDGRLRLYLASCFSWPVVVLGRRPSKTPGFLRFSIRPCDPLRTLGCCAAPVR